MKPDPHDIHVLMIQRLAGSIGETEAKYLDDLIEKDDHVREKWEIIRGKFKQDDFANHFERFNTGSQWEDIEYAVSRKKSKIVGIRRTMWAAAAVIFAIVTGYFLFPGRSDKFERNLAAGKQKKSIELQLANGQTINLSANTGQVLAGSTTLNNAGKTLSYSATNGGSASVTENILKVPIGLDYKVLLSDGTEVWMNSATTLRFPFAFSGGIREITLNGEAFLKVAKDSKRPFIVHLPGGTVNVLGTEFNINTYDSNVLRVSLIEGSVKVKSIEDSVTIKPGQEAIYTNNQKSIAINQFDEYEVLSWLEGMHHFHNATVKEICNVFPRWYGVDITMDDESLANNRFSGTLNRNEPLENFLTILKTTKAVNGYYYDEEGVLHLK